MERQQAVSIKISKYLLKADGLYQHHLASSDGEQVTWNRWGVSGSLLSGGIASCSASDSAYSYTFLRSVVCLSVCHIRASCLHHSMDLDAIWQLRLWGPMTHCVT